MAAVEQVTLEQLARLLPNTDRETLRAVLDLMSDRAARGEQGDLDPEQWESEQVFLARAYLEGAPRISGNGA
jgi:hypothetical protein